MAILTVLNILFVTNIGESEKVSITSSSIFYIIFLVLFTVGIYFFTEWIDQKFSNVEENTKKRICLISKVIYFILCALLIIFLRPPIVGDQIHACNLAETFYTGDNERYLPNTTYAGIPLFEYMQAYYQQITLAFMFSIFLRIIHFDGIGLLTIDIFEDYINKAYEDCKLTFIKLQKNQAKKRINQICLDQCL